MIFNNDKIIFYLNNRSFGLLHSEIIKIIEEKNLVLTPSQEDFVDGTLYCATGGVGFDIADELKTHKDALFFYRLVNAAIKRLEHEIPCLSEVLRERYWYFNDELNYHAQYLQGKKPKKIVALPAYQSSESRRGKVIALFWVEYMQVLNIKPASFKCWLNCLHAALKENKVELSGFLTMLITALQKEVSESDRALLYLSHYLKTKKDALLFANLVQEATKRVLSNYIISRHLKVCLQNFHQELLYYAQKLNDKPEITFWDYCKYFLY